MVPRRARGLIASITALSGTISSVGLCAHTNGTAVGPELIVAEGFDNLGRAILVEPVFSKDESIRRCLVEPAADKFTLNLACTPGSYLSVDGKTSKPGEFKFKRTKDRHTQVVEVSCTNPYLVDPVTPDKQKYALLVSSDYPENEIPIPKLWIESINAECLFEHEMFKCPKPQIKNKENDSVTTTPIVRMLSENQPDVKYLLQDGSGEIDIRLLNGRPTVPFRYKSKMQLVAISGRTSKTYPVRFGGSIVPSILRGVGFILSGVLGVLLLSLLVVVGCASLCGMGTPLGATEIAAALTLLTQYLCFSNFLRGTNQMESLVAPMKWITLFWAPPSSEVMSELDENQHFAKAPQLGDITDIRTASGCLIWSLVGMLILLAIHGGVLLHYKLNESRYTIPHRVRFGNWENRLMNWLAFPLTAAATVSIVNEHATLPTQLIGSLILALLAIWIGTVFVNVASSINNQDVCWIWNSSVRESGRPMSMCDLLDGEGFWGDVVTDQLLTQPVSRSLLSFFPYRWVSTVADIYPTSMSHALIGQKNESVYPPQKMKRAHRAPAYPTSKAPQIVSVVRTCKPTCYLGHRLMVGLLRTSWLDLLFTYEGLVKFFTDEHGNVEVPLVVKTNQLSGRITSGSNAFFYDGARVPFIRISESLYKIFLGVAVALCALPSLEKYHCTLFGLITAISFIMATYIILTRPYSRKMENWLLLGIYIAIGGAAISFCFYKAKNDTAITDFFLWILATCTLILSLYAALVIYCVFSAVMCPPLNESRFLERLSNCTVTIVDPSETSQVEIPGYSKHAARDLLARSLANASSSSSLGTSSSSSKSSSTTSSSSRSSSSRGKTSRKTIRQGRVQLHRHGHAEELCLEFDHHEIRQACKSGDLPIPS